MVNHLDLVKNTVKMIIWFMKDLCLKEREFVLVKNGMMMEITIAWYMKEDIGMENDVVKVHHLI